MARHGENIYKRKDGRYEGRYVTGRKDNGKTKFGYVFGYQYTEVQTRLIEKKAAMLAQAKPPRRAHSPTLTRWMTDWMEGEMLGSVKPSSYQTYQNLLQKHLLPVLGRNTLSDLTPRIISDFIDILHSKGLSESTIRSAYRLLSAGLRSAFEEGLIQKNPCRKIRVQRRERVEARVLNREEQQTVEAALSRYHLTAGLVGMYTGLRLGEICGLKWSDIDWQQNTIAVCRTVQRQRILNSEKGKTYLAIGSPKSLCSCRRIPIPSFLREILKARWSSMGVDISSEDYIFGTSLHPAEPRTLQRQFERVVKGLGFIGVHFHTLRHSYGTRLLELGVDIKTVSVLLGHGSVKTTLDCYIHSLMDQRREAVKKLDTLSLHF